MPFTEIRYEVADGVCTITLHRPEKLNAFTRHDDARAASRRSTRPTPTTRSAR